MKTADIKKAALIDTFVDLLPNPEFAEEERQKIAILVWKSLPSKAEFAQSFSQALDEELLRAWSAGEKVDFNVPKYIRNAIEHAVK